MDARRAFADRVEPFDIGRVRLGVDEHSAHRVMRRRRDLHGRRRDVEHREVDELPVHPGKALQDRVAVEMRDVEQHAAVRRSSALGDLQVVGKGDTVARRELHALRVVALHEALAGGVPQDPALAANCLGHEDARGLLGRDHPGRMELDELHVAQAAPGLRRQPHRVAGVLVAPRRRAPPDTRVAARREDDRVRDDHPAPTVLDVEAVGAEHAPVVHEQAGDVDVVANFHAELGRAAYERALDLAPGVVAREARPAIPVGAEEPLGESTVALAREADAEAHEIVDRRRRLAAEKLDRSRIGKPVRLAQRVRSVLLPAVVGIHRAERGVDAAGREDGVGVVAAALPDAQDLDAPFLELDRRAKTGRARADDEHADGGAPLVDCPRLRHRPLAYVQARKARPSVAAASVGVETAASTRPSVQARDSRSTCDLPSFANANSSAWKRVAGSPAARS